jgi:thiosulfate reductase cytochrome b subunit
MRPTVLRNVKSPGELYYRHRLPVRIMHWINVVAMTILLMSGLNIFNGHPALYLGQSSYTGAGPVFVIGARRDAQGVPQGVTRIGGREFDTTGLLGVSKDGDGDYVARSFPSWATIPSYYWLAMARSWHIFFAWVLVINGLAYVVWTLAARHLTRDLAPDGGELRSIGRSIVDHLRFRHPTGEAAKRYNVLQKVTYLGVIFVLAPAMVLMGLAMSPWADAALPGWVDWVGGRQTARTLHFVVAWLLVAFVAIHVFMVIVAGPWNHVRSMITGRYRVKG